MSSIPNTNDGSLQRSKAPALPIGALIERKPQRLGTTTADAVSRGPDRVDFSADAALAGAELAQRLQSVRDAVRDAAASGGTDESIEKAQSELDHGASAFDDALSTPHNRRREGPWWQTRAGGVRLDAQWNSIDLLGSTSRFHLEVEGRNGAQQLTFASGTNLSSIAAAVNSFTEQTGVTAQYTQGQGIVFRRSDPAGFTSIHVIDDGGLVNGGFSIVP